MGHTVVGNALSERVQFKPLMHEARKQVNEDVSEDLSLEQVQGSKAIASWGMKLQKTIAEQERKGDEIKEVLGARSFGHRKP